MKACLFPVFRALAVFALVLGISGAAFAVTAAPLRHHRKKKVASSVAAPLVGRTAKSARLKSRKKVWAQTWDEPTYKESTAEDKVEGEDLNVRKAAVEALGPLNGAVVVADPTTGRILSIVNQPLALSGGFQPCSTIKVSVALAALREGLVERTNPIKFYSRRSMDLTDALAYSNNYYFANLGIKLGYERVNYYAHLFGYGEKAGLNVDGEHAGFFPAAPPKNGGMGMLTSFGEEISQTPLELAGLMSAVANGGTLYWLQYPKSQAEVTAFQPQVKRHLDIANLIDQIKPGMKGAVEFGTARRAKQEDEILGKTGTCSEGRTHLGWFGSFNETGGRKLVVVVMLTGGKPSIGATASGVAGDVYKRLASENFFKSNTPLTPAALLSPPICCSR
ncbi:MAG: penicillin-binding transpeptidase domain-containing protein [Acidobacteriota bacterium]|nr:penicillin-binding transpeptidase domain-containing protein [Acidobacteriota bacterium]